MKSLTRRAAAVGLVAAASVVFASLVFPPLAFAQAGGLRVPGAAPRAPESTRAEPVIPSAPLPSGVNDPKKILVVDRIVAVVN
ncbi:MAG: hypothetical protein ABIU95_00165, partial [Burkholderiales bacterium]